VRCELELCEGSMTRAFDKIEAGLNEALAIVRGEAEPARTTVVCVPAISRRSRVRRAADVLPHISADVSRETLCSTGCGRPAKPGQRYCRECHAAYMRGWRQDQRAQLNRRLSIISTIEHRLGSFEAAIADTRALIAELKDVDA
jgi:hypothetical protein